MTTTSTTTRPQTASTSHHLSAFTTIGAIVVVIAVTVVLLVSSLTSGHHPSTRAPLGAITPQTAEGRAAAEQVPAGLLPAAQGQGPVCRPSRVVQVC